jgi:triacylglycerol lipase
MPALVLLHGLGRTKWSLWPVAREARRRGRTVHNFGYPSRSAPIEALAERVGGHLQAIASSGTSVDVVTHSMGGIVLRAAVAGGIVSPESLHRVVMLAPPNHGSELADRLRDFTIYRFATGPAGQQIGTGEHSVPRRLPAAPFEVGIIAGRRSTALFGRLLGAESDGKVTVESARLEGMRDLVVVDRAHTFIMWAPDVLEHIFSFLETGRFSHVSS